MKLKKVKLIAIPALITLLAGCSTAQMPTDKMPFGGKNSVAYSQQLWDSLSAARLAGPNAKPDGVYKGTHPHGAMLETLYSNVTVNGHKGEVVVKRNYGGKDISAADVTADRAKYLKAVTVMFKREAGYDKDNQNWYWAKFKPDGSLHTNPKGMMLAGRVAKGKPVGCIACHKAAPGGDYLFTR